MAECVAVKIPYLFPQFLVLALLCSIQSPGAKPVGPPKGGKDSLVFVYVHGFGGVKESPEFCDNLREFLVAKKVGSEVINYEWDSVKVDVLQAGASWIKSQEYADAEAPKFKREVIDKLEREGRPYVLVGFSVGSRVVFKALEATESELEGLRGVYFLGSAMTKDTTLKNRAAMPNHDALFPIHSGRHRNLWFSCRDCHPNKKNPSFFTCNRCHSPGDHPSSGTLITFMSPISPTAAKSGPVPVPRTTRIDKASAHSAAGPVKRMLLRVSIRNPPCAVRS